METRNSLGFRPLYRQARDILVGRIKDGAFLMDLRCLDDESGFIAQLAALDRAGLRK